MGAPHNCQDASQVAVIPHVGHIKGTPIYVCHNNGFRLGMMNFRRDTGGGGAIADDIVGPLDSMFRDIAINFYNKFASLIVDQKIFVGNAALQTDRAHRSQPAG